MLRSHLLHVGRKVATIDRGGGSGREHLLLRLLTLLEFRLCQILADLVTLVVGSRRGIKAGVGDSLHALRSRRIERVIGVDGSWDRLLGRCLEV